MEQIFKKIKLLLIVPIFPMLVILVIIYIFKTVFIDMPLRELIIKMEKNENLIPKESIDVFVNEVKKYVALLRIISVVIWISLIIQLIF